MFLKILRKEHSPLKWEEIYILTAHYTKEIIIDRPLPKIGSIKTHRFEIVERRWTKRLVVNRFHRNTKVEDISELIGPMGFDYTIVKLKTRNEEVYSSFVIGTSEENIDTIQDSQL